MGMPFLASLQIESNLQSVILARDDSRYLETKKYEKALTCYDTA